jgi:ketosteroid isomerase-like protein
MARSKSKKAKPTRTEPAKRAAAKRKPTSVATRKPAAKKRPAARAGAKRAATGAGAANRGFAQRIIDVTLADRDEEILALYAENIESSEAGQPPAVGIEALRAKYAGWRSMTSDTSFEPRRVAVDGNVIVIEWVGRVTLAASGRQVEMHEVAGHEVANGQIVREAFYYNPAVLA